MSNTRIIPNTVFSSDFDAGRGMIVKDNQLNIADTNENRHYCSGVFVVIKYCMHAPTWPYLIKSPRTFNTSTYMTKCNQGNIDPLKY